MMPEKNCRKWVIQKKIYILKAMADLNTSVFDYTLPEELIADKPLPDRDQSRLLVYRNRKVGHATFQDLCQYLPEHSAILFNDTRVIPARLVFHKKTGAKVEVFCLEPNMQTVEQAFASKVTTVWKCQAGNIRKWEKEPVITKTLPGDPEITLHAELLSRSERDCIVRFTWTPDSLTWSEVLNRAGEVPLPPYINRKADESDKDAYQTVYAQTDGAVAAPTAGLHFTPSLMNQITQRGFPVEKLTLHTGVGTFRPVSTEDPYRHDIHKETVLVNRNTIHFLRKYAGKIIMTGTTSLRAAESIYWLGVYLLENNALPAGNELQTEWVWKKIKEKQPSVEDSLAKVNSFLQNLSENKPASGQQNAGPTETLHTDQNSFSLLSHTESDTSVSLRFRTGLYILPGHPFKLTQGLITNFHLPRSTLLMLVAAFIGDDWRDVYKEALEKRYRLLSYGDGSLLIP
jgi:S-adenosylmethionine:tRNA ribosyltransferase-isomerase